MAIQIIRDVNVDVVKRGAARTVYAKQNDVNSRFLNVRIQEDGNNIVVTPNLTVMLNALRPDNTPNMFACTVNADGTVRAPLAKWILELEGTVECDISIVSEDPTVAKLTTMKFNIHVESAVVCDEAVPETEDYGLVVNLLKRVSDLEKSIGAGSSNINMTRFDEEGVIVETFADGTEKTTTMEFDNNGNPIKITDSDGNVTVLTW